MWPHFMNKKRLSGIIIFLLFGLELTVCMSGEQIKEGSLKIGSAEIYYKTMGIGTPTFIMHGGPGDTHDTMLQLSPLSNDFKLIFMINVQQADQPVMLIPLPIQSNNSHHSQHVNNRYLKS